MQKKWWLLTAIIIIVIVISVIFTFKPVLEEDLSYYSDDPATWIEDKGFGKKELDVEKVSQGRVYLSNDKMQFDDGRITQVFVLNGLYFGEEFFPEYIENQKTVIKISPEMNPRDGIMEGYIVEDIIDEKLVVHIFLDENWKNKMKFTNIIWGGSYQNIKAFEFNEIKTGIYMDEIKDDRSRFDEDFTFSKGGIIVGNITLENLENPDIEGVVFIELY